jgi:hypothetical protein
MTDAGCTHPPTEYFCWYAYDCVTNANDWLVICCKACHATLKGSNEEYETYLARHGIALP